MQLARRTWLPSVALLALGLALTLPRLGASGLWDPWEPKYAQTPREMAARGDWIIPWFHDDPRLNKPPLTYWLIGAAQAALGPTETAARLPSALLGVAAAVALSLAFAAHGRRIEGLLAGAALLTSPGWVLLSRFATPDVPLASFLGIALAAILATPAARGPGLRRALFVTVLLSLAAAGLTEWPRGWLLPAWAALAWGAVRARPAWILALAAASALYAAGQQLHDVALNLAAVAVVVLGGMAAASREGGIGRRTWLVLLAGLFLLAAPWFVAAYRLEPQELSIFEYKNAFNLGESIRLHRGSLDAVVRIVALGGLPWSAVALAGLLRAWGRSRDPLAERLAGALVGALLYFTLAEPRMGHFYAVLLPAVAGLAAVGIGGLARKADWRAPVVAAAAVAIGIGAWNAPSRILEAATVKHALYGFDLATPAVAATVAWAVLLLAALAVRRLPATLACVLPAALFAAWVGMRLVPALDEKKSVRSLWRAYEQRRAGDEPIALLGEVKFGCYYYSNDSIVEFESPDEVRAYLAGGGDRFFVSTGEVYEALSADFSEAGSWEAVRTGHPTHLLARFSPFSAGEARLPTR